MCFTFAIELSRVGFLRWGELDGGSWIAVSGEESGVSVGLDRENNG